MLVTEKSDYVTHLAFHLRIVNSGSYQHSIPLEVVEQLLLSKYTSQLYCSVVLYRLLIREIEIYFADNSVALSTPAMPASVVSLNFRLLQPLKEMNNEFMRHQEAFIQSTGYQLRPA